MTTTELRRRSWTDLDAAPDHWGGPRTVTLVPAPRHPTEGPREVATVPRPERCPPVGPRVVTLAPRPRRSPDPPPRLPDPPPRRAATAAVTSSAVRSARRPVRHVLLVLWLGSLLVVLVAGAPTPTRPAAAPAPSPARSPGRPVPAAPSPAAPSPAVTIAGLVGAASTGHVSIAALDVATGRSFGYASDVPVQTASVVKLDVLETLLLQTHDAGRKLTPEAVTLATRMIENSDNDAATRLWNMVGGGEAVARANVRLGTHCTRLDDEHWGNSTTCAADQVALLGALVRPAPLTPGARDFATDLLTHVQDDQRWGISAAADPGAATGLKNGWLPVDDDGGRWIVNSVGVTTVAQEQVLLAVLTEHQPSEEAGIALVEALARPAARAVVSDPRSPADP